MNSFVSLVIPICILISVENQAIEPGCSQDKPFRCGSSSDMCYSCYEKCDGIQDCDSGLDENFCYHNDDRSGRAGGPKVGIIVPTVMAVIFLIMMAWCFYQDYKFFNSTGWIERTIRSRFRGGQQRSQPIQPQDGTNASHLSPGGMSYPHPPPGEQTHPSPSSPPLNSDSPPVYGSHESYPLSSKEGPSSELPPPPSYDEVTAGSSNI